MAKSTEKLVAEAKDAYREAVEHEAENREDAEDDIRFARLGEQWDPAVRSLRESEGRPCLTINRQPTFIRQVVNDGRMNKPSIRARPVDSGSDPETAKIFTGIIRHIEQASNAGIAYDVALDSATTNGYGYICLNLEYLHDDTFDTEPRILPVENVFSIVGDPWSKAPDGSDWNTAFEIEYISTDAFKDRYPKADAVDFESDDMVDADDKGVTLAKYWARSEVERKILLLSDGTVVEKELYEATPEVFVGLNVLAERDTRSHKVMMRILSGVDVLEDREWIGRHIPIIPVYGDRVNVKGKVYTRSLVRDAKDPQRMFNYWRTASTEIVALAPKAPFIGKVGSFNTDAQKWQTAHSRTWPYIEYDGDTPPQRQAFAGVPAGMIQEALNASDDMKSVMGLYDASLGARSNETSGRAIMARQKEGDVSTFHFVDNLARGLTYLGRQLVDIIPRVYGPGRIVRVLGEDGKDEQMVEIGGKSEQMPGAAVYDLSAGHYDVVVDTGPGFTTRREEAAVQMTEFVRHYQDAAPVIGDLLVKNLDWPGADEIAERLKRMIPPTADPMQSQAVMEATQRASEAEAKLKNMEADRSIEIERLKIEAFEAETDRLKVLSDAKIKSDKQQMENAPYVF